MAEDSQADYVNVPSGQKQRWATPAQKILFLLVGLNMLGLVVERWSIYNLHEKIEVISLCMSLSVCQNLSGPQESVQQGVTTISPVGLNESSEILTAQPSQGRREPVQRRPFAHLDGAHMPEEENNRSVLQWEHQVGASVLSNMGYNNGRLLVQKTGFYYIYSKVTVNAAEECLLIAHKVKRFVPWYAMPIDIMQSASYLCPKDPESGQENGVNLWNSFLGGIFHLQSGGEIFVTLDNVNLIHDGEAENFLGAFMI